MKFLVRMIETPIHVGYVEVTASCEEEARAKAEALSHHQVDWQEISRGDLEVDAVDEIKKGRAA